MTIEPESRKSEVALQIVNIAEELGLPLPKVGYMRFQDERVPKLWREESGALGFNEAFAQCSDAEIRFAATYLLLPAPSKDIPKIVLGICIAATLLPFVIAFAFEKRLSSFLAMPTLVWAALSIHQSKQVSIGISSHLEKVITITGDPISARMYLDRTYGKVVPSGFLDVSRRDTAGNPIFRYLKYGKDERLKAILKSDLVHPVGPGEDSNPDSGEDAPTDEK